MKVYSYFLSPSFKKIWLSGDLAELLHLAGPEPVWLEYREWLNLVHPDDREKAEISVKKRGGLLSRRVTYRLKTSNSEYLNVEDFRQEISVEGTGKKLVQGMLYPVETTRQSTRAQEALYEIARLSVEKDNLVELLQAIHLTIRNLMPAENFYIALYDKETGLVSFPYFVDEYDQPPPPQPLGRGLTEYVLRTGEPLLASPEVFARLESEGQVESVGAPSVDWLGVPLKVQDEVFGVMVVQSYTSGLRYSEEHLRVLSFVASQAALVIKKNLAEELRKETERLLTDSFASIQDGISILDMEMRIVRVNPVMEKWYAHALPLVGKKCHLAYHGKEDFCDPCPSLETLRTLKPACEIVPRTGAGGKITGWLELFSFPLIDHRTGRLKGVIEYVRDITERKKAHDVMMTSLKEKEVLLKEVHHRVKNNMQIISSLLNLQSNYLKDPEARNALKECQNRIYSMALVHDKLYREKDLSSIDFGDYADKLLVHLFQVHIPNSEGVNYSVRVEAPALTVDMAIPLGLILTELVSNSLKHAFSPGQGGSLQVSLLFEGKNLVLEVRDNGRGYQPGAGSRFGLEIVRLLAAQLGGEFDITGVPSGGTLARVSFPSPGQSQDETPARD
ncbi:MAG: GAF domain-containing protein [Candidatus Saccharicenans sp.]|nr:GAF domain-containing protein [Candidatus Saccharicenans sp.]